MPPEVQEPAPEGDRPIAEATTKKPDDLSLSEPAPLPQYAFFVRRLGQARRGGFYLSWEGVQKALGSAYARRPEQQGIPIEVTLMRLVPVEHVDIDGDHQ